jgi:hypothetical protein
LQHPALDKDGLYGLRLTSSFAALGEIDGRYLRRAMSGWVH